MSSIILHAGSAQISAPVQPYKHSRTHQKRIGIKTIQAKSPYPDSIPASSGTFTWKLGEFSSQRMGEKRDNSEWIWPFKRNDNMCFRICDIHFNSA